MFQYNSLFGLPFNIIQSKLFQCNIQFGLPFNIIYLQLGNIKVLFHIFTESQSSKLVKLHRS